MKQEMRGGSGISWTICKSYAPRSRQITIQHLSTQFYTGRMLFLPPNQQRQSTEGKKSMNDNLAANSQTVQLNHAHTCLYDK